MDHALTNQDLGSDEASSSEAPLDDTELQRRLVETFEKELAPGGARSIPVRNRVGGILLVLAVFAMWWAFGVPQLLHGWFTDWWTMSSASSRHQLDQATWDMLVDPNWTPAPPTTIWQDLWEYRSVLAMTIGGFAFFVMFLGWLGIRIDNRNSKRYREQILQGARAFGLHACPDCGADTRSVEGRHCRTCRGNIRRDRVPAYWRHRIREDFPAEGHDFARTVFADHATDPRTRKRAGVIWIGATLLIIVVLSVLNLTVFPSSGLGLWLWVWIISFTGITKGVQSLIDPLQYSDSGFCPKCKYDLGETDSGRCPECGTACPVGYRIHLLESRPAMYSWVTCVIALGWLVPLTLFFLGLL